MNKKFFAALASATMAFSATGSLAVFADEFTDEVAPVAPTTPNEKPTVTEVVWNEENFGDLADNSTAVTFPKGVTVTLKKGEKVDTKDLAKATSITLPATFNGEVKGLEYFTGLTRFDGYSNSSAVKNTSLDFSANTNLTYLGIKNAPYLRNVVLPEAFENEDGEKSYKLNTLALDGTKLLSIDLTEQTGLTYIELTDGMLKDIQLPSNAKKELKKLYLNDNMLETMNLKGFGELTSLNLSNNHIGMLDLTGVDVTGAKLANQTIYVAEDSASVNVNELYPSFDYGKASVTKPATDGQFEKKNGNYTGVFTLVDGKGTYNYNVNDAATTKMNVNFVAANPMFRLYNPNSGEHFYTKDANEQEALVKLGWNDEGYGWVAPTNGTGNPVYRLYNPNAGDHHYTTSLNEKAVLVAAGWKDESIGWYSDGGVTVYRQYNPNAKAAGAHNYTMDLAENDYLVSVGWTPEGDAWLALK